MPPKGDLIRFLVVFGVVVGVDFLFWGLSPWPWFVEMPISLAYVVTIGVWYRRRYGDRWPIYGRSWWEQIQTWPTWNQWVLGGIVGLLGAILMILFEGIAWSGWD